MFRHSIVDLVEYSIKLSKLKKNRQIMNYTTNDNDQEKQRK